MIKMIRVDYRLLHGQVAVSWTSTLGADALLLVSDTVRDDPLRMETLRLAKPAGIKVVVKSTADAIEVLRSGVTDKYKLFVVCETVQNAAAIVKAFNVKQLNLGNIAFADNKVKLSNAIYVDENESASLKEMVDAGVDVFVQMVPTEKKVEASRLLT